PQWPCLLSRNAPECQPQPRVPRPVRLARGADAGHLFARPRPHPSRRRPRPACRRHDHRGGRAPSRTPPRAPTLRRSPSWPDLMLDDFFARAVIAGIGIAIAAAPLGCFVVWRRMAYFGDTMAHSALLGIALSLLLGANPMLGVFAVATLVSAALLLLSRRASLSTDA